MRSFANRFREVFSGKKEQVPPLAVASRKPIPDPHPYIGEILHNKPGTNANLFQNVLPDTVPLMAKGADALIGTNETIGIDKLNRILDVDNGPRPKGCIFGVGFGGIFLLLPLFEKSTVGIDKTTVSDNIENLEGIYTVDLDPFVVLFGLAIIQIISECKTFDAFIQTMKSAPQLHQYVERVKGVEDSNKFELINDIDLMSTVANISSMFDKFSNNKLGGNIPSYRKFDETIPTYNVLVNIRRYYDKLHNLAKEGKFTIGLGDITDENVAEVFRKVRGPETINIYHFSNVIDHLTKRGTEPDHNVLKIFRTVYEKDGEEGGFQNIFCYTLQNYGYKITADFKRTPPAFEEEDVLVT